MDNVLVTLGSSIPKTIAENGLLMTISTVFILLFIAMIVYFIKRFRYLESGCAVQTKEQKDVVTKEELSEVVRSMHQSLDEISNKISSLGKSLDDHVAKEMTEKSKKVSLPKEQMGMGLKANDLLRDTLEKTKCDRIDVFLFSNGKVSTTGRFDFLRFTHSFTYCRKGGHIKSLQELPFTFLSGFFNALNNENVLILDNDDSVNGFEPIVRQWIDDTGAETAVFSLLQGDDNLVGFSVAYFDSESSKVLDRKSVSADMIVATAKIGAIIG